MEMSKEFKETFEYLSSYYNRYEIFCNLMKMCAISMYNAFSKNKDMEQEYLRTINLYKKEHQNLFPKLFSELIKMFEKEASRGEFTDILGEYYGSQKLANSRLGQFFTPQHISDLMAKISVCKRENIKKIIEEKGFIAMSDPTCGSGRYGIVIRKSIKRGKY